MNIFLFDAETEAERDDYECDLDEAINEFYELSDADGSFLGINTYDNRIIQFLYQNDDEWLLDIPSKDNPQEEFFQRLVTYDKCVEIITSLFNGITVDTIQQSLSI